MKVLKNGDTNELSFREIAYNFEGSNEFMHTQYSRGGYFISFFIHFDKQTNFDFREYDLEVTLVSAPPFLFSFLFSWVNKPGMSSSAERQNRNGKQNWHSILVVHEIARKWSKMK